LRSPGTLPAPAPARNLVLRQSPGPTVH
jgi:hypothetical protein